LKAIIFNKSVSYCAGGALIMANRKKEMVIKKQINTNLAGPRLLPLKKAADYIGLTVWAMREKGSGPVIFLSYSFQVAERCMSICRILKNSLKRIRG
jgi:hypothetical protein